MIELWIWVGYFAVGLALFFSFWRWLALEGDGAGNNWMSFSLLFLWPVVIPFIAAIALWCLLLKCGKKVMKK